MEKNKSVCKTVGPWAAGLRPDCFVPASPPAPIDDNNVTTRLSHPSSLDRPNDSYQAAKIPKLFLIPKERHSQMAITCLRAWPL